MSGKIALILSLIERVLNGDVSADAAMKEWPEIDAEKDDLLSGAWHELSHYAADADIRTRDLPYAEYQKNLLIDYQRRIREKYK